MKIEIFGKQDCARCETTKKKVTHYLQKWNMTDSVELAWIDLDTVDGRAEGAFQDVMNTPTVILKNDDDELHRWDGVVPDSNEMRSLLEA